MAPSMAAWAKIHLQVPLEAYEPSTGGADDVRARRYHLTGPGASSQTSASPAVCPVVATRGAGRNERREMREQPWAIGVTRRYQAEVHCYQMLSAQRAAISEIKRFPMRAWSKQGSARARAYRSFWQCLARVSSSIFPGGIGPRRGRHRPQQRRAEEP
jgi:hypothetical protein